MKFWRAVLTLSSGSAVAMVASVAGILILPRLYDPGDFGRFGVFFGITGLFGGILTGGFDLALMLPRSDDEARQLGVAGLLLTVGGSILAATILALTLFIPGYGLFPGWHGMEWLLPLALGLEGAILVGQGWKNRRSDYRRLALVRWLRPTLQVAASAGLYFVAGGKGLILAWVAGQLGAVALLWPKAIPALRWDALLQATRTYQDFPRFSMVSHALNQASRLLPFIIMPYFFGETEAGYFTQADRVLMLPMALVSLAAGQVFYQDAARTWEQNPDALAPKTLHLTYRLLAMILPFGLVMVLFAPEGFSWVMGPGWARSGEYARWLTPWLVMAFLASPLSFLVDVRRKLPTLLWFNLGLFVVRIGALAVCALLLPAIQAVAVYGFAGSVMVLGEIIWFLHLGGVWAYIRKKKTGNAA